jgi:steroid delta-isomerase-like uncharacterized protein
MADYRSPEMLMRAFFDALARHDFARAAGAIAENCHWQSMATGSVFIGPEAIVKGLRDFAAAFPDWSVTIERLIVSGNLAVAEWDTSGTFLNTFRGQAPNGRRFQRKGCAVAEIDRGMIVQYRDYYDRALLLDQLGLMHLLAQD